MSKYFGFEPTCSGDRYFVSYTTADGTKIGDIARCLNNRGVPIWYDYGIPYGVKWEPEISKEIKECTAFILFVTKYTFAKSTSNKDPYVDKEYAMAKQYEKKIIIVWLDDFVVKETVHADLMPFYIEVNRLQRLDAINMEAESIAEKMINEIGLISRRLFQPDNMDVPNDQIIEMGGDQKIGNDGYKIKHAKFDIGDRLRFGSYSQGKNGETETLIWRVLDVQYRKALLISEKLIDCMAYNEERINGDWTFCSLRKWLNHSFIVRAFESEEQKRIDEVRNENQDSLYCLGDGRCILDKIFLLTVEEAARYFENCKDRMSIPTPYAKNKGSYTCEKDKLACGESAGWWWLRSTGESSQLAAVVNPNGEIYVEGYYVGITSVSVRPALWLKLNDDADFRM